jgi:ABC-type transporter Mla subunit MlaD
MQREVPIWVAVVAVIVVVLIVAGIYWLRQPKTREGANPPPTAPIFQAPGPGMNPMSGPRPSAPGGQPAPTR